MEEQNILKEENNIPDLIQRPKLSKNIQFGADADIFYVQRWWNTDNM